MDIKFYVKKIFLLNCWVERNLGMNNNVEILKVHKSQVKSLGMEIVEWYANFKKKMAPNEIRWGDT